MPFGRASFKGFQPILCREPADFFQNSLEFPFLIYRNGQIIARTPFFVNKKDGSIQLVSDVHVGEKFRIGYGNPQMIIKESVHIQNQMQFFKPNAIFLYTCICRRFLLQEDINLETLPFNNIAPTAGFYTFGEFCSNNKFNSLLNSTMVAVGFREGAKSKDLKNEEPLQKYNITQNSGAPGITAANAQDIETRLFLVDLVWKF